MLCMAVPAHAAISSVADAPTWTVGQPPVEAFAPDGDRVWVGGNFTTTAARTGPGLALDLNGNPLAGFPELTDSTGNLQVSAVTSDGKGGWFVAGSFTRVGGVLRPGLVHIAGNGGVDTAFDAQVAAGTVSALTLSGGLLYVGGTFTSIGGQTRVSLAALSPTSGTATGWDPPASAGGLVDAISIQGGFAWVGGGFTSIGATAVTNAAKVPLGNVAVNADATWVPNPNFQVRAVVATATNVYMGGIFTTVHGTTSTATNHLTKTDQATGTPDAGWLPDVNGFVNGLASDGTNLYAAGTFSTFGGATRHGIAAVRLDNTGAGAATTWYPGDFFHAGTPNAVTVAGGVVYFGGAFAKAGGDPRSGLAAAAADATGTLLGWAPETTGSVAAVAADGTNVYAGGRFGGIGATNQTTLMAIDLVTGRPMPYFNHTFDGDVRAIAVCNGVVYVGGTFFNVDGQNRLNAAAFDRNTGALMAWDPQSDNDVDAIACGNGVIYLGGIFQILDFNNVPPRLQVNRGGLAAVDPVVGEPTAWDPGVPGNAVNAIAVRNSTLYAAGSFATIGNPAQARVNLAAIDTSGVGAATGWDPNVPGGVSSLALAGTTIYAAGSLTSVGGAGRTRAAEIRLDTGVATAWNPAPDALVRSIALAPDGTIYMAGNFNNVGGQARTGVAAVDSAGNATTWNPRADGTASAVAAGADGRVFAGGGFDGTTLSANYGLAIFSEPTSFATQPSLTSAPVEGQAVTCDGGTAGGSLPAPQTFQWQLDGAPIAGATGSSYTPTTSDVGHALSCHVSQRNLGSTAQADSASMSVAAAPVAAPVQAPPPVPFDIDGFAKPPPPVVAKSVVATPTSGTVLVLLPTFKQYIPLPDAERIPVGTIIDARKGVVRLTTVGKNGKLQSAIFYEGVFQVFQEKGKSPMVELRLYGGNFSVCKTAKRARVLAAGKIPKSKSVRHLWGNGKGLFRTKGRYASATIRGTQWLTDVRCDGTLVRVAKGAVTVRDIPKKKSLALKAPKSYLALARR